MELMENKKSYIFARDPSITPYYIKENNVVVNLEQQFAEKTEIEYAEESDGHLNVFLRMKGEEPFDSLYLIDGNNLICKVPEGSFVLRNAKEGELVTKTFTFSRILEPNTTQCEIFNLIVKLKIVEFINGKNSNLLTYGASGSGKTFTIVGTPEEPGVIPRALEYLFRTLLTLNEIPEVKPLPNGDIIELDTNSYKEEKKAIMTIINTNFPDKAIHQKTYEQMQQRLSSERVAQVDSSSNVSVSIWVSFAEIYNENIYDLLTTTMVKGKVRPKLRLGNNNGEVYIKNLTLLHVSNGMEAYQVLQYGLHNLNYAATAVNSHSSRSHSIFSIKLVQSSKLSDEVFITNFNFCDLAGTERLKKTGNIGDRLKESNNINTSLLVLGRCIENVRNLQTIKDNRRIPFRESKLTQLFQKALLGKENISMMVNINLSKEMFDETQHVLNFSAIAKDISIEVQPTNIFRKKNRFSLMVEKKICNKEITNKIQEKVPHEREDELKNLHTIIDSLYAEIETLKNEHAIELAETEDHAMRVYTKYIDERTARFEAAKNKQIERIREEHQNYIAQLKEFYENKEDVINISSSSDEASLMTSELEQQNKCLMEKIDSLEKIDFHRVETISKLRKENKDLKTELDEKKMLLECAEQAYVGLRSENEKLILEGKKIREELLDLKEKNEALALMLSSHRRSIEPEEEESAFN